MDVECGKNNAINHPWLVMGIIASIRMVMTGGWFMKLFYPHEFRQFFREKWLSSSAMYVVDLSDLANLPTKSCWQKCAWSAIVSPDFFFRMFVPEVGPGVLHGPWSSHQCSGLPWSFSSDSRLSVRFSNQSSWSPEKSNSEPFDSKWFESGPNENGFQSVECLNSISESCWIDIMYRTA